MIAFLIIASLLALLTAWLVALPSISSPEITRREKQKTLFFILLASLVFPMIFYLFIGH